MMTDIEPFPFGTRVKITHTLEPCYVQGARLKTREPGSASGFQLLWEADPDAPLTYHDVTGGNYPAPDNEGLPGLPLDPPSPLPERGVHRMLRRHLVTAPTIGIVIGYSFRMEGQHFPGSPSGGYYDPEPEPAYFEGSRRVPIHEVALPPGHDGGWVWPARTVIATLTDIKEMT
jgi:hypothetical protein